MRVYAFSRPKGDVGSLQPAGKVRKLANRDSQGTFYSLITRLRPHRVNAARGLLYEILCVGDATMTRDRAHRFGIN